MFFASPCEMNDDFDSMLYFSKEEIDSEFKRSAANEQIQSLLAAIRQGEEFPPAIQNIFPPEVLAVIRERVVQMCPADANKHMELFRAFFGNQLLINASEITQIVQKAIKVACFSENINSIKD